MSKLRSINTCNPKASSKRPTDREAQGLFLADTFAPRQHVFDFHAFFDVLSASALPGDKRTRLAGKISLGEDMVRDVRQALTLDVRQVEADALCRGVGLPTVNVLVVHPDGYRDIHYVPFLKSANRL